MSRKHIVSSVLLVSFCLCGFGVGKGWASVVGPMEFSGSLGYSYRLLAEMGLQEQDNASHQLSVNVGTSTYVVEPWLATADLSLSFTQDSSTSDMAEIQTSVSSQIITGDLGLNVLPRSKTPLTVRLRLTDSRTDREQVGGTPVAFVGEEYSTTYLGLRQSYFARDGARYRAFWDLHSWDSVAGSKYASQKLGLDADVRRPRQHLFVRGSLEQTKQSASDRENDNAVLDLNHHYYPVRGLRLNSKASLYQYDRSFLDLVSDDTRLSTTNIAQVSSVVSWRPTARPLSFSGGVRFSTIDGSADDVSANDQSQISANMGLFYNLSQYARMDASLAWTSRDVAGVKQNYLRSRVGGLYQSTWRQLLGFMRQWYSSAGLNRYSDPLDDFLMANATLGHNVSRTWFPRERTTPGSLRLNLNQALRYDYSGALLGNEAVMRLDHSLSLAFNQDVWQGHTLVQLTLSDSRDTGDSEDVRQLVNFQLGRDQDVSRRMLLAGNITLQYVAQEYDEIITYAGVDWLTRESVQPGDVLTRKSDTTSATGRLRFEYMHVFGVPRLRFSSSYMVSRISTEGALDREDWEGALHYSIGLLDANFSYRLTDTDGRNYDLLYFRVLRRF